MTAIRLFSYGTLPQPEVQRATFGRLLDGEPDVIAGYRVDTLRITDPDVIARSGSDQHPILVPSDDPSDGVPGLVFEVTAEDLAAADEYEVGDYVRIEVPLIGGGDAWVYVFGEGRAIGH